MDRDEALKLLRSGPDGVQEWNQCRPHQLQHASSSLDPRSRNLFSFDLAGAELDGCNLEQANLSGVCLVKASLQGARLGWTNLSYSDLAGADLSRTSLNGANLRSAHLRDAKLNWSDLAGANLAGAVLAGADLSNSVCLGTIFVAADLSETKGLGLVKHEAPSMIGTETLIGSRGKIPEAFLRGCGLPESWITNLPALIGALEPIHFHSCFISYSTADEEFASRLHNDFQVAGIRCWKWDHDARTGRSLWGEIDQAIREYDKLVRIASKFSLKSPAVNREVERAIVQEDERAKKARGRGKVNADVLFPVTLDDFIFKKWKHERKVDVTKKVIADAKGWDTDTAIYARVRDRLIRDLKTAK